MIVQTLVEAVILGACHELRARPAKWLAPVDWSRACATAVIEYHAERERKRVTLGAVLGMGLVPLVVSRSLRAWGVMR